MSANRVSAIAPRYFAFLVLGLLLLAGLWYRIAYARTISLHVDEFISLLAIRGVLQHGYPLLPSGMLYEQALLFSYLGALPLGVFGLSATAGRALSVAFSLVTIALVYWIGSQLFSRNVGLIAAALMAFSPESIAWGARVRMYALLQLLVLLVVWFVWRGGNEPNGARYRWVAVLCYLGALFTHPVSVLLFAPLLLGLTLLRGVRGMLKPAMIPELLVPLGGILATLLLKALGQPGQLEALAESRPYLAPSLNVMEGLRPITPFFSGPERIPLALLAALGMLLVGWLAISAWRKSGVALVDREICAPLFLYTIFGATVLEFVFLVGPTWRDVRYLFMVEPLFFLLASWTAVFVLGRAWRKLHGALSGGLRDRLSGRRVDLLATTLMVVAACVLSLPAAQATLARQEWGYDLAFEYLKEEWQEGDAVLTIVPYACQLYLPGCDYYASGRAYEEYVLDKDGVLIDRWIGSPLLSSASQLVSVLKESPRTWLVIDGWRLASRFDLDFVRTVAEQMDVTYERQGVRVLLADGHRSVATPETGGAVDANFGDLIELSAYEMSSDQWLPGSDLNLTLYWRALQSVDEEYTVFVHLRGSDGSTISQDDYPPLKNLYPTYYWSEGETVPDPRVLPVPGDVAPGWYRLEVGLYGGRDEQRLLVLNGNGAVVGDFVVIDYVWVGEERDIKPAHQVGANLNGKVQLLGHDGLPPSVPQGQALGLSFHWQAVSAMNDDYTIFVHLLNDDGQVVAQYDGQPLRGFYPTSLWEVGESVVDQLDVTVGDSVPVGNYRLAMGMYLAGTGERLPVMDEAGQVIGDVVSLGKVFVEEG